MAKSMTKTQVQQQHRESWIEACKSNPALKTDRVAFSEDWAMYTDMLCKDGYITDHQYSNWSTPAMPKSYR